MTENSLALIQKKLHDFDSTYQRILPKHYSVQRFIKAALSDVQASPKLLLCKPSSIAMALLQAAELQLEIGSALGFVYLVPYKATCKLMIGYKGYIDLAYRHERIEMIEAQLVYQGEPYELILGDRPCINHTRGKIQPQMPGTRGTPRGRPIAAYAFARLKGAAYPLLDEIRQEDIDHARSFSAANNEDSPWNQHYDAMVRKTVLRRICSRLPKTTLLAAALTTEEDTGHRHAPLVHAELLDDQQVKSALQEVSEGATTESVPTGEFVNSDRAKDRIRQHNQ